MSLLNYQILDFNKVQEELANLAKKTGYGNLGEFSGSSGDPEKVKLTKGGTPRDWQALTDDERWEVYKQAGLSNTWLNVSFQTPRAFGEVIDSTEALVKGYKAALEAGKTLMYANRTLALATLNPAVFALEQLIELAKSTIDDIMGAGIYILSVNSQELNMEDHKVGPANYNLEFNRFNLSGLSVNPFTNNLFFHVQPIEDINLLVAKSRQFDHDIGTIGFDGRGNPYDAQIRTYKNDPSKYLIYNGKIFDRETKKPVLMDAKEHYDIPSDILKYVTSPFKGWKICPPKKMLKIINNSFDDKLDSDKPMTSNLGRAGALIMIAGTTDPTKIAAKVVKLYNYFSSFGPLRRASNIFLNAMNTTYKYRTEEIVIENLCAPNNFNNPKESDWPFVPGEDGGLLALRDEWKLGHNSDNFARYGSGIRNYNKDKVILKNLRTKEIMQIISVGEAKRIEIPSARGNDVVMTNDGQIVQSVQPGGDPLLEANQLSMTGIDIFNAETQTKKVRYRQKIIVQHQDFFINTKPGDVLVEVEVSGFRNLNKDGSTGSIMGVQSGSDEVSSDVAYNTSESQEIISATDSTAGISGGLANFSRVPIFTLKNGTPFHGDDEVERIFRLILMDRLTAQGMIQTASLIKAYFHYSDKINTNPVDYRDELTYFVNVPESEARQYIGSIGAFQTLYTEEGMAGNTLETLPRNQEEASLWLEIKSLDEIISRQRSRNQEFSNANNLAGASREAQNKNQVAALQTQIDQLSKQINDIGRDIDAKETESQKIQSDINNYNLIRSEIEEAFSIEDLDTSHDPIVKYDGGDILAKIAELEKEMQTNKTIMDNFVTNAKKDFVNQYWPSTARQMHLTQWREDNPGKLIEEYSEPSNFEEFEQKAKDKVSSEFVYRNPDSMYLQLEEEYNELKIKRDKLKSQHENSLSKQAILEDTSNPFKEKLAELNPEFGGDNLSLVEILDKIIQKTDDLKDDLKDVETQISILKTDQAKLDQQRLGLDLTKISILNESEFDNLEESITRLEEKRLEKYQLLRQMISNRPSSIFDEDDTFTIEKLASGRWQRTGLITYRTQNYDYSKDTMDDYEVVMDQNDSEAKIKFENLLQRLVTEDDDNVVAIPWSNYNTYNLELTDEESAKAITLFANYSSLDFDPSSLTADLKALFENMLDQHLYLPRYKNTGANLPAPRYCNVLTSQELEEDNPIVDNDTEGMYPDWNNDLTLENILPGFRNALNLIVTLLDSTKGALETIITVIDDIIEFIETEIIPELEELIDIIEEFIDILKIGIIDAGIWFLHIPVENGGVERIRNSIATAKNPPPENIDFTYGLVLLQSAADEESTKQSAMQIVEPLLGLS